MRAQVSKSLVCLSVGVAVLWGAPARAREFQPQEKWNDWFAPMGEPAAIGDFDGDGRVDIATSNLESGAIYVSLSSGDAFRGLGDVWARRFPSGSTGRLATGDFDGDGRDDVVRIGRAGSRSDAYVALSTGSSFAAEKLFRRSVDDAPQLVGDFNGDGRDDLALPVGCASLGGRGVVRVYLSTGSSFAAPSTWPYRAAPSARGGVFRVGDVDRDGDDDLVRFSSDAAGDVFVARAEPSASRFAAEVLWNDWFSPNQPAAHSHVADLNGDGRDDIFQFTRGGRTYGALSTGTRFEGVGVVQDRDFDLNGGLGFVGDADGDGFADEIRFANDATGDVFVARSNPFGFDTMRVNGVSARGIRPFVTILVSGSGAWRSTRRDYEEALSEIEPLFAWNSGGAFRLRSRAVLGPFTVDSKAFPGGPVERNAHAAVVAAAMDGFDFTQFDSNRDGAVTATELELLVIDTYSAAGGATRSFDCQGDLPGHPPGFRLCLGATSAAGHRAPLELVAHELSHQLGTLDLYGHWDGECLNTNVSMMGCNFDGPMTESTTAVQLDAWHKMRLGWIRPRVRPLNGENHRFSVSAQSLDPKAKDAPIVFYDPDVGANYFFLVENRSDEVAYDESVAASGGLAIWEVQATDSYAPLSVDGRTMVMAYGAPSGTMGGPLLWTADSPNALLSIEGSGLTPELDVVASGRTTSAWITHDGCHPSGAGTPTHCSEDCPCSEGAADCDGDLQCAYGLTCVDDAGAQFGYSGQTDVCLRSCHAHGTEGRAGYCTPACPCGEGMGRCATDDDCTPGLACGGTGAGKVCMREGD